MLCKKSPFLCQFSMILPHEDYIALYTGLCTGILSSRSARYPTVALLTLILCSWVSAQIAMTGMHLIGHTSTARDHKWLTSSSWYITNLGDLMAHIWDCTKMTHVRAGPIFRAGNYYISDLVLTVLLYWKAHNALWFKRCCIRPAHQCSHSELWTTWENLILIFHPQVALLHG